MPILETSRASVIPPNRNCPVCGSQTRAYPMQGEAGIRSAQGTCIDGHTWVLKWVNAA